MSSTSTNSQIDTSIKILYPKKLAYPIGDMVTTENMTQSFQTRIPENKNQELARRKREEEILKAQRIPDIYYQTLNLKVINNLLTNDFYQYNTEEGIHILSEQLLVGKNLMETSKKVHQNIKELKELASGANGKALIADVGDKSGLFKVVVKSALDPREDDLFHEVFVGLAGTNKLRKTVPNFAYIYGGFRCSGPGNADKNKEVKQFCSPTGTPIVSYALYENIKGKNFKKSIPKMTTESFLASYLQAILALQYANITIDFTHYDMHSENIILRDIFGSSELFGTAYPMQSGNTIYVYSNTVPTMIDYGYSHIKYKNFDYGTYRGSYGQNGYKSYPLHDAFKLLMFCAFDAATVKNQQVLDVIERLFPFFSSENFYNVLDQWRDLFYELPNISDLHERSIERFVVFIENTIDVDQIMSINQPLEGFRLLQCSETCLTLKQVEQEITSE